MLAASRDLGYKVKWSDGRDGSSPLANVVVNVKEIAARHYCAGSLEY